MKLEAGQILHIAAQDLKAPKPRVEGHFNPQVIWVHADIKIPEFLATELWAAIHKMIEVGANYVIITEHTDPMQMSLKNIQFRH